MYKLIAITGFLYCMLPLSLDAQTIRLSNPSFEDQPQASSLPSGWHDCGKPGETPPDTQPGGGFKVATRATDGNTYLGMVTRNNDTWEAVGQLLRMPLEGSKCYNFSLYLSRSEVYESPDRLDRTSVTQYIQPIKLRIWGGNDYCGKKELLDETAVIAHTTWRKYDFKFNPRQNYRYILLEAFYNTPTLMAYNGNLLVDKCSAIIACDKEEKPVLADASKPKVRPGHKPPPIKRDKPEKPTPNPIKQEDKPKKETKPVPKPEEKKTPAFIPELEEVEKIKKGQTIRVNNLSFKADSFALNMDSYPVLDEIYDFLSENDYITIEIGGHTNNIPPDDYCNKLSKNRAKTVAYYLIDKGISRDRISFKGYGKTEPVATNKTVDGRRKNQRVEIKIISMEG